MHNFEVLNKYSKEQLMELIEIYSINWLALDGVWFQSIEQKHGMDEAIYHDEEAWRRFTAIEARRLKKFLNLPEQPGLEGLKQALSLRLYANVNEYQALIEGDTLTFKILSCRVQNARERQGMIWHPCKSVGIIEYSEFAKTIDSRITCRCLSCYPELNDDTCCCKWQFSLAKPI